MITAYPKSNRYLLIAAVFCAVSLSAGVYKVHKSWNQIRHYASAYKLEQSGMLLEAEEQYRQAAAYRTLTYKTKETDESLQNLKPVSEIKAMIGELNQKAVQAGEDGKVPELVELYRDYAARKESYSSGGDEFSARIFEEASEYFQIGRHLDEAFASNKNRLVKSLQTKVEKKTGVSEKEVESLLAIAAVYEKPKPEQSAATMELVRKADQLLTDAILQDKGFEEVLKEMVRIASRYNAYQADSSWLYAKLDEYAGARIKQAADQGKAKDFASLAKAYTSNKEAARKGSPVPGIIKQGVSSLSSRAAQLAAAGSYQESLDLYNQLSAYTDMSAAIKDVESRWLENDPGQLLSKAAAGKSFTAIIGGRATAGGTAAAAGLTEGKKLGFASLSGKGEPVYEEAALEPNVKVRSLKFAPNLSVQGGPVILADAESSAGRAHRYLAYEATGAGLRKIWDADADGYTVEKTGTLLVDNIPGDGAGQKSYFEIRDGKYTFARVKPDYVEIALGDLPEYRNVKVRFTCTILTSDGGTAVVSFNNEYLLLQGNFSFKPGTATVTGTWSSTDTVKKGAQSINAYVMKVSALSQ